MTAVLAKKSNLASRILELSHWELGEYVVDVADGEGNCVEPGLHVPNSYLDNCGKSFIAADGERVKTPGQHFSDTGMMAVIIWSNMWMPGEQQFYALAIIDYVMAQLPVHCTLKWNLLPQWMPWIIFGISVFHAYGHHFHCRLFLLDLQIEHQDHLKLCQAGVWLEKHVRATKAQLALAEAKRDKIQYTNEYLQAQFEAHIASQNEVVEIMTSIAEQENIVSHLSKQDNDLMAVLQLGDPISYKKLQKMRGHAWFEHQLNMWALKAHIIAKGGISRNAIIPPPINMKGLFGLDVNNDIWQDIGLANDEFDGTVSPWLGGGASNACQDDDLKFFLREHIQTLCDLGKRWGQAIDALNVALPGGVSLVFEVDSSDDEEDFELEPPLVLADSAILAAADYTHQQGLSSDEGSQSNGTDSEDE
ncbi:hypothetical protein BS47DRAFT_1367235 [Hydnum rufescens UP504]|uniref:Uncharacterized protein n=1 Tax=Hydnum rufescens UP504 TaxID=1448309 RepID=A0A9P6AJ05_9AGAM|nr:hypothetical protein BS47DRAFT_1367235 [Hydnum rufescens UP504]